MAINKNDFEAIKNTRGLKRSKSDFRKFLFRFKVEGKEHTKIFTVTAPNRTKRDCLSDAKVELERYKREVQEGINITESVKLEKLINLFFDSQPDTKWNKNRKNIYSNYIQKPLGTKSIQSIKKIDINRILIAMNKRGLKPRTCQTVLSVLKPVFDFAIENNLLKKNPAKDITVKIPEQKKYVTNATDTYKKLFNTILELYNEDPFYKALFLFFALTGRRKGEVLSLKWENIDLNNDYYWLGSEDIKNATNQKYRLPEMIKTELLKLPVQKQGLVFPSPVTGRELNDIKRQVAKVKAHSGIENLTLHYIRNVLVSFLAEQGTEATFLSGLLGHKDSRTINKYLTPAHLKGSEKAIDIITNTIAQ